MGDAVKLIGLDFGTTTTSAVIARATLARNTLSGRTELRDVRELYRSEILFTPFDGDLLDEAQIAVHLDAWLLAADARPDEIFGGGAIVTGLAARRANAQSLTRLVRSRLHNAVIATADDPGLESWLAFMGSAAALSRARPEIPLLNLDIGGGTTNLALGLAGEVCCTGALFVGARHVQVEPGSTRIVRLSDQARDLLAHLGIGKSPGDTLDPAEIAAVVDFQTSLLEAAVTDQAEAFQTPLGRLHLQAALRLPPDLPPLWLSFSGGVGELYYALRRGEPPLPTTYYGDLGIELAQRMLESTLLSSRVLVPEGVGRATSYGLLLHSTTISGSTLHLPRPEALPLVDLPILARLSSSATSAEVDAAVALARRSVVGAGLVVTFTALDATTLRATGRELARALRSSGFPPDQPLVLLVRENVAKALGGYVTEWGKLPLHLVVVDEITVDPGAHFVQIGALRDQVVPVSFHGMTPGESCS
jgi:ethanolamine utilization protein EutA